MSRCERFQAAIERVIRDEELELQSDLKRLSDDFETEIDDIQDDVPDDDEPGVVFTFDIDVDMVEQSFKMHLPRVTTEPKTVKMHLPQSRGRDKEIKFHVPETVMVRKRVGSHPETTCKTKYKRVGGIRVPYPHCTTVWKPAYAHVPEVRMKERRIVFTYPEITMKLTEFQIPLPKFSMELKEIKFHTPSITIRDIRVEAREAQERAENAEREFNADTEATLAEFRHDVATGIRGPHTDMFECYRNEILQQREQATKAFEGPLAMVSDAIKNLKNNETDEDRNQITELEKSRADLVKQQKQVEKDFANALKLLQEQQEKSLDDIVAGLQS